MHCDGGESRQGNDTSKKTEKHQKQHFFVSAEGKRFTERSVGKGMQKRYISLCYVP